MKLYTPDKDSHKGQNGKLMIIGGSSEYHGAPMLSILAARRFVDLVYFYPPNKDDFLINAVKTIPEVIVEKDLKRVPEMDCVLFGIGLGSSSFDMKNLKSAKALVIDGDGIQRVKGKIPKNCILTPHEGEFKLLFGMDGNEKNVKEMARKHKCVILRTGPIDIISDGTRIENNLLHNRGMTKGGTGDVLAGLVAALACKNDHFESAVAGARINGRAGEILKEDHGFNFCASDLAEKLTTAYALSKKLPRKTLGKK